MPTASISSRGANQPAFFQSRTGTRLSEDGTPIHNGSCVRVLRRIVSFSSKDSGADAVASGATVRRLTPTECERLQGFPDGWTCLCGCEPYSTAACRCPDGPRYEALCRLYPLAARVR